MICFAINRSDNKFSRVFNTYEEAVDFLVDLKIHSVLECFSQTICVSISSFLDRDKIRNEVESLLKQHNEITLCGYTYSLSEQHFKK